MSFRWLAFTCAVLAVPLLVALADRHVYRSGTVAEPVRFYIPNLSKEVEGKIELIMYEPDHKYDADHTLGFGGRVENTFCWTFSGFWVARLLVRIPENALPGLEGMTITLGDEDFFVAGEQVRAWEKVADPELAKRKLVLPGDVALAVPNMFGHVPSLPWISPSIMNWPGDVHYLRAVGQTALIPILLVWGLIFWLGQKRSASGQAWSRQVLGLEAPELTLPDSPGDRHRNRIWNWGSFLFLLGSLAFLEIREPYYFCQCDTMVDIFPQVLVGCRSIWQGEFPDYNPYLFLGSPLASLGVYSLTYPPLHLSYALARHVLGQEYATMEVFAILHLLAGYFATRALGCKVGLSPLWANLTALSFVLSGAMLIMGRSWSNFIPLVVWLPVLFLGLVRLRRGPVGWQWVLGMGLASGLPFHVGFSQVAVYINGFFVLAVLFLVLTGSLSRGRALMVAPALCLGAAIALPLVYQQWRAAQGLAREKQLGNDWGIAKGLPASLLPYPLTEAQIPSGWGNAEIHYQGHFYFFGGILALAFLAQLAGLIFFRPRGNQWGGQVWTFCAVVALWLALGDAGGFWGLLEHVPLLQFINRHPMRLMPCVVFFVCFAGALFLNRLLALANWRRCEMAVAVLALVLLGVHVVQCRSAFLLFHFQPYPGLPDAWQNVVRTNGQSTGRIHSWAPVDSPDLDYGSLVGYNIAGVYEVPTLRGMNAVLEGKALVKIIVLNAETFKVYGVRWHIQYPAERLPPLPSPYAVSWVAHAIGRHQTYLRVLAPGSLVPVATEPGGGALTELKEVDPLAFCTADRTRGLNLRLHGRGIDVDIAHLAEDQKVVVNFLHYPEMRAFVDGQSVKCFSDGYHRILVVLPARGQTLALRYSPPWATGLWLGLAAAALAVALAWVLRKRQGGS